MVTAAHNACIRELLQEVNVHGKADRHMRLLMIEMERRLSKIWDQEECNQFCSEEESWEAARDEEMKIPWQAANEGPPVPEEQDQERFWRRRLDGIGLDKATKEFLAIEFKRTQDERSSYVESATAVAQEQYKSLLTGLQAVGQVKGWKVQQIDHALCRIPPHATSGGTDRWVNQLKVREVASSGRSEFYERKVQDT